MKLYGTDEALNRLSCGLCKRLCKDGREFQLKIPGMLVELYRYRYEEHSFSYLPIRFKWELK